MNYALRMKARFIPIMFLLISLQCAVSGQEWVRIFDGKSMEDWEPSENKDTWRVEDGALVSHGERSHLFYKGKLRDHNFKNFELRAEVRTRPGSNSGIYIHTHYQEKGFPETGYECQVINSNGTNQQGGYVERKMTSSIYAIRNVWKSPTPDFEWFHYHIVVRGKTIQTFINEELMAEYTESENPFRPKDKKGRLLSSGTVALQGHDGGSVVAFRNLEIKPLADEVATPGKPLEDTEFEAKIIQLSNDNFPLLDLDVKLSPSLPLDRALANSRKYGYTYGFVFDERVSTAFRKPPQAFIGLRLASPETFVFIPNPSMPRLDYLISELPLKTTGKIADADEYMEQLVERIVKGALSRRIEIWSRPTALPEALKAAHDALWTEARINRVIAALKEGEVAVEINDRLKLPNEDFIRKAKEAGLRFTFGSDNTGGTDLGRLDYCINMIKACGITAKDIWMPQGE